MKGKPIISATIYLKGYELDPTSVSQILGIEASRSQRKGGLRAGSTKFIAKIGMWGLQINSRSRSSSELIDELLQRIGEPVMPLSEIQGVQDAHLDVLVAFDDSDGENREVELTLNKSQLEKMYRLGLSACFTVA